MVECALELLDLLVVLLILVKFGMIVLYQLVVGYLQKLVVLLQSNELAGCYFLLLRLLRTGCLPSSSEFLVLRPPKIHLLWVFIVSFACLRGVARGCSTSLYN